METDSLLLSPFGGVKPLSFCEDGMRDYGPLGMTGQKLSQQLPGAREHVMLAG